jgi:hypothetical protein
MLESCYKMNYTYIKEINLLYLKVSHFIVFIYLSVKIFIWCAKCAAAPQFACCALKRTNLVHLPVPKQSAGKVGRPPLMRSRGDLTPTEATRKISFTGAPYGAHAYTTSTTSTHPSWFISGRLAKQGGLLVVGPIVRVLVVA